MVLFKIGLPDDASALFSELALHTLLRAVVRRDRPKSQGFPAWKDRA